MPKPIFISHAEADRKFVDHFFDTLLGRGLNLSTNDVFCTSLPGAGIKTGQNFFEYIKKEVKGCKVIILILTPQYMESPFCLAEAGASWVLEDSESCRVLPVVVPPLKFSDLEATLAITQAESIEREEDLDDIRDALEEAGVLKNDPKSASWTVAKKKFDSGLAAVLDGMVLPTKIDPKKYNELEAANLEFLKQSEEDKVRIEQLKAHVEELGNCENWSDALAVKSEYSNALEVFQELIEELKKSLVDYRGFELELLYYGFTKSQIPTPQMGSSDSDSFWDDFHSAHENKLVSDDPSEGVNIEHPRLKKPLSVISKISDFVENNKDDIREFVEENWECTVDVSDRVFWNQITGGNTIMPRPR